ncbi:hypothetical protein LRS10_12720 [Phenylobacterium sp. J426]|uniref:cell division protein ZapB n=1 Tax=Phenylobacterium sp. J426 TaxID=2898439 RepID=UPI002150B652|nr:cell division protein ZapB [Phenylobacterium sp. J426]MCR5874963.1 hypothetical protein [Phenylobacterium sp. J426]
MRQSLALEAKLARDAQREAREAAARAASAERERVRHREAQVRDGVEALIWREIEGMDAEEHEAFEEDLMEATWAESASDTFFTDDLADQVARVLARLGFQAGDDGVVRRIPDDQRAPHQPPGARPPGRAPAEVRRRLGLFPPRTCHPYGGVPICKVRRRRLLCREPRGPITSRRGVAWDCPCHVRTVPALRARRGGGARPARGDARPRAGPSPMSGAPPVSPQAPPPPDLARENAYLKQRVAQLEGDVTDLSAENQRLREERERLHARRAATAPNPLGAGQ